MSNLISALFGFPEREKSATKEAISLFAKYIQCGNSTEENSVSKRRKISEENVDGDCVNGGDVEEDACSTVKVDTDGERGPLLKLSVESGSSGSLLWCNRIFPIQATCSLNEKELREVVSKLVLQFVKDNQKLVRPIKFAIGYNRRGIETELNTPKETPNALKLLDRNKCFALVASAVKDVVSDSVVDLKTPELSVLVELLPLSGVPKGSFVVAVSVLPRNIVSAKPKLSIKALVSDTKTKGEKLIVQLYHICSIICLFIFFV
ncbi:hypothetical protein ACLB2K_043295 [Fragaria x ananassa]